MSTTTLRMPSLLRRLARDKRGVSAVEFALLMPLMIGLYFGCAEVASGIGADRKVSLSAATLANLASQVTTISSTDMTNIMNATSAIITPYSSSHLTATLSCIKIDSQGRATVAWSATLNGTARTVGASITIPSALAVPSSQLLLGEASYAYTPTVGYYITGTINLSDQMYMAPRITAPTYGTTTCT